jgi:sulfate adenylyltransferase subunit 1
LRRCSTTHGNRACVDANHGAGIVLDREVDVSRGDWLYADDETHQLQGQRLLRATVAWLDDEALVPGRVYWALHGHRWVKAKVNASCTGSTSTPWQEQDASQLEPNAIGHIELALQEPLLTLPYARRVRWAPWCWWTPPATAQQAP